MGMMKKQDKARSYYADVFQKFRRHRMAMVGLYVISLVLLAVFVLPPLLGLDPITSTRGKAFLLPGGEFPLGLDGLGRDNLARLLYGGRTSIQVGLLSTAVSILIGVPLGLCAGYFRGWFEALVMRLVDVFMSFPSMILILVLVSVVGPSIWSVTLIIGIMGWPDFARIIRDYILPNAFSPVLVTITYRTASAILQEAALSYLGMGVQPPAASLGNILNTAQSLTTLTMRPWFWVPPGILLVLIVLSINFIGDGMRDALDPKMKV